MVKDKMHLHEYTLFDLNPKPKVKVTQKVALYIMWSMHLQFAVGTSNGLGGDVLTTNVMEQTDQLWYEIYKPFFLKKKIGIINRYDLK